MCPVGTRKEARKMLHQSGLTEQKLSLCRLGLEKLDVLCPSGYIKSKVPCCVEKCEIFVLCFSVLSVSREVLGEKQTIENVVLPCAVVIVDRWCFFWSPYAFWNDPRLING